MLRVDRQQEGWVVVRRGDCCSSTDCMDRRSAQYPLQSWNLEVDIHSYLIHLRLTLDMDEVNNGVSFIPFDIHLPRV
jgi:hypothetical protein